MNKRKQTTNVDVSGITSNEVGHTDGSYSLSAVPATSTRKPRTLGRRRRLSPALSEEQLASAPDGSSVTLSGVGTPFPRATLLTYSVAPTVKREPQKEGGPEEYPKLGVIIR